MQLFKFELKVYKGGGSAECASNTTVLQDDPQLVLAVSMDVCEDHASVKICPLLVRSSRKASSSGPAMQKRTGDIGKIVRNLAKVKTKEVLSVCKTNLPPNLIQVSLLQSRPVQNTIGIEKCQRTKTRVWRRGCNMKGNKKQDYKWRKGEEWKALCLEALRFSFLF